MKTAIAIMLLFALWLFCYPAPVRTPTEQPTEIEKRVIRSEIKRYGNYIIVREGDRRTMKTEYGEVRL